MGEWQYEYLAGIVPTSPGYAAVRVRPLISKSLPPSSVDASVTTVRGVVTSHWTRNIVMQDGQIDVAAGVRLVTLGVVVPDAVTSAEVHVPLLGCRAYEVAVHLDGVELTGTVAPSRVHGWRTAKGADGDDVIVVTVATGSFAFVVLARDSVHRSLH